MLRKRHDLEHWISRSLMILGLSGVIAATLFIGTAMPQLSSTQEVLQIDFVCTHTLAHSPIALSFFAYSNSGSEPLVIEHGVDNHMAPGDVQHDQPRVFEVGRRTIGVHWNRKAFDHLDWRVRTTPNGPLVHARALVNASSGCQPNQNTSRVASSTMTST